MSAYVWWKTVGDSNGLVNAAGVPQPRGFVMAQYSRFIRPGFNRIAATNNDGTLVTAYRNTNGTIFAIVAVNPTAFPLSPTFNLQNFPAVAAVTPWVTSSSLSFAVQPSVTVTNSAFTYTLPAMSVATFAGQIAANTPPVLVPVADQVINAGMTLVITNHASDTDSPPQSLTYTLLNGPTNASISSSNGVFAWRPLMSQSSSTNPIVTRVTDSGIPPLSATNSFKVTVNPVVTPVVTAVASTGGQVHVTMNGATGPDYTLLVSTNLSAWSVLFTTNSPMLPVSFTDTNTGASKASFYRAQIGP
jgi:hypothetical protein